MTTKVRRRLRPGVLIVLGFAATILLGAGLLLLPPCRQPGVRLSLVDALFTSTSAVCVTGLLVVDTAETFTVLGRAVVALLIQIGGLGVSSIGVGVILLARRHVGFKQRLLVQEGLNLDTPRGAVRLLQAVLGVTLCVELVGMALSFIVFSRDYAPLDALGISAFHAIATFNNAGFDILGGMTNLIPYQDSVLLNLTTAGMIILGGLGFLVLVDVAKHRRFRRLTLHSKIVLVMTGTLLLLGTVLLCVFEPQHGMDALLFETVSAFGTVGLSTGITPGLTAASKLVLTATMYIGRLGPLTVASLLTFRALPAARYSQEHIPIG